MADVSGYRPGPLCQLQSPGAPSETCSGRSHGQLADSGCGPGEGPGYRAIQEMCGLGWGLLEAKEDKIPESLTQAHGSSRVM